MKKLMFLICLVVSANGVTQDFRFGKVSEEELQETSHKLDVDANAAILFKNENIDFVYRKSDGFMQERTVHERIKIYNSEGYDWATKRIYLYEGGSGGREKLTGVKGYTYNLIDGKIQKDKLKNDGVFSEDFNEYTEIQTITMPNIQDGAVIEYTYKIISPYLEIDDIYFQSLIPTNKLEVTIAMPQFYLYNRQTNTQAFYQPVIHESRKDKVYSETNSKRVDFTTIGTPNTTFSTSKSEYYDNILTINDENIPGIVEESYAGNLDNYISKMSLELSAVLNQYGGVEKSLSTSWDKVSKTIYEYSSFGGQLARSNFFEDEIEALTNGIEDPFQKSALLHEFVKSKVKWNGNYGFTSHHGIKDAYREGSGNVGDINLLLAAMLKSQSINAYPVLVSTKNNGIPLFPTRKGFNYVVVLVENDGNYIMLDATDPFATVNVLPQRALNWRGRLLKADGTSGWIPLRPSEIAEETTSLNVKINEDFSIEGKVRKNMTDHIALNYRNKFVGVSDEDHIKSLEKDKGDIIISELKFENEKEVIKPVKVSFDYSASSGIDEIGGNLYFSPLLFLTMDESPFKLDKRDYPIDFIMPFEDKYLVNIMLPEGYKVESMPENEILQFKDGAAQFSYVGKVNGKYLQLSISFELLESLISASDYPVFKDFFEKIVEKQTQQIVLTKA